MARDISIRLNRCQYCNRPGFVHWDVDVFTCGREVCKALAFAEVRRRHREGVLDLPEKRLARALLTGFDTFDYALRLDQRADVVPDREAETIRERERQATARLLAEINALARRYPAPPRPVEDGRVPRAEPRLRRFVRRGVTVPLRAAAA